MRSPAPTAPPVSSPLLISQIQGFAHVSPYKGQWVEGVRGVVTQVRRNGFFVQDPDDVHLGSSTALFVYQPDGPTLSQGDAIQISGQVGEFRPGREYEQNLSVTQIVKPQPEDVEVVAKGRPLPEPVLIGKDGLTVPRRLSDPLFEGYVDDPKYRFDPQRNAIDFYESLSGMRVRVENPVVVGPTHDGRFVVLPDNGVSAAVRTTRGGLLVHPGHFNPDRLIVSAGLLAGGNPQVNVGDCLGPLVGILHYTGLGDFELLATEPFDVTPGGLERQVTRIKKNSDTLVVASVNVENLSYKQDRDPGRFERLADLIVKNLNAPDVLVLEEIQDNDGPDDTGQVDASETLRYLTELIHKAGGPKYEFRGVNPHDGKDGGQPGGNIRNVFLFNPERVSFKDKGKSGPDDAVQLEKTEDGVALSLNPGRIDPQNKAFKWSRKPLVGEFVFNGQKVFVVGNHFKSKGSDDPTYGRIQPPRRRSEAVRKAQARAIRKFVDDLLAQDPGARVLVMGDLNDYEFSETLRLLEGGDLTNLVETLPPGERYSYVRLGNSQALDHVLVSQSLRDDAQFEILHVNAEFADQVSDHDIPVAGVGIKK